MRRQEEHSMPREKLLERGPEQLKDEELIAILLRTGVEGTGVLEFARNLLINFGGLVGLLDAGVWDLRGVRGIGSAKLCALLAAGELARRYAREVAKAAEREPIRSPQQAVAHFVQVVGAELLGRQEERVFLVGLDARLQPLIVREIFRGSKEQATFDIREILTQALRAGASRIIVFHNHPSGQPDPSPQDRQSTERLRRAADIVGIELVDHLVLGTREAYSILHDRRIPYTFLERLKARGYDD